jgi:hypothetical protein
LKAKEKKEEKREGKERQKERKETRDRKKKKKGTFPFLNIIKEGQTQGHDPHPKNKADSGDLIVHIILARSWEELLD